ncbi:tetratricopeptide repeat protein [Brasilonema sp. UFV-L1]|uniref:tetratricopeptide repeat protein n=1 Tax=Brasilonema sp. UFV-L1 TaxID=2234130 RepID=UPI001B7D15AD|nr:tetratricopeptide repeat protein [Brasilonema sp. UFV-L1]
MNTVSQQLQTQPDSLEKVTALRSLGNAQQQLGDLEQSKENLQQSLEIAQRLQLPLEISLTEFSLGNTARVLGKIEDAITHYENAALVASNPLTKVQAQINQLSLLALNERIAEAQTLIPTIQSQLATVPTTQVGIYARINFARTISKIGNQKNIAEI